MAGVVNYYLVTPLSRSKRARLPDLYLVAVRKIHNNFKHNYLNASQNIRNPIPSILNVLYSTMTQKKIRILLNLLNHKMAGISQKLDI